MIGKTHTKLMAFTAPDYHGDFGLFHDGPKAAGRHFIDLCREFQIWEQL